MQKIKIVTDSTCGMDPSIAEKHGIELVSLSVEIDGKEYRDHIDITKDEVLDKLKQGALPTTSQPNIGYVRELMEGWSKEDWDSIIIISISSYLSGTCQGFHMMANELEMDNVHIVDSLTVAAPMMDAAIKAKAMAEEGKDTDAILQMLDTKFKNTVSFLYPATLTQLKKGGRISPVAANMASMLKIKPLLMLKKDGTIIDKYGLARTETKLFDMIYKKFVEENITSETHCLYIPQALGEEAAARFITYIQEKMGTIDCHVMDLPAVLSAHAGIGTIAMQSVLK